MDLEVAWSGAMERNGTAAGLSSYKGRSSIFHSANWERAEALEYGKTGPRVPGSRPRVRGAGKKARAVITKAQKVEILAQLRLGCSYGAITRALDVTVGVVRRVARDNGIDRSHMQGDNAAGRGLQA